MIYRVFTTSAAVSNEQAARTCISCCTFWFVSLSPSFVARCQIFPSIYPNGKGFFISLLFYTLVNEKMPVYFPLLFFLKKRKFYLTSEVISRYKADGFCRSLIGRYPAFFHAERQTVWIFTVQLIPQECLPSNNLRNRWLVVSRLLFLLF